MTNPQIDEISKILTKFFSIAKTGNEDEIREAQIECNTLISLLLNGITEIINQTELRHRRLIIKQAKIALSALRASLSRINRDRRLKMKPRNTDSVQMNADTFKHLVKAINSVSRDQNNYLRPKVLNSEIPQHLLHGRVVTEDPVADEATEKLRAWALAEIAAGRHPDFSVRAAQLKAQEKKDAADPWAKAQDINNAFKPSEDGTVDLSSPIDSEPSLPITNIESTKTIESESKSNGLRPKVQSSSKRRMTFEELQKEQQVLEETRAKIARGESI